MRMHIPLTTSSSLSSTSPTSKALSHANCTMPCHLPPTPSCAAATTPMCHHCQPSPFTHLLPTCPFTHLACPFAPAQYILPIYCTCLPPHVPPPMLTSYPPHRPAGVALHPTPMSSCHPNMLHQHRPTTDASQCTLTSPDPNSPHSQTDTSLHLYPCMHTAHLLCAVPGLPGPRVWVGSGSGFVWTWLQ